jgi:hypothetical protein
VRKSHRKWRPMLNAVERLTQIDIQPSYVVRSSSCSTTNKCAGFVERAGIIPLKCDFCLVWVEPIRFACGNHT